MYSPLNSYLYIHWILEFKYILLFMSFHVEYTTSDLDLDHVVVVDFVYRSCVRFRLLLEQTNAIFSTLIGIL